MGYRVKWIKDTGGRDRQASSGKLWSELNYYYSLAFENVNDAFNEMTKATKEYKNYHSEFQVVEINES